VSSISILDGIYHTPGRLRGSRFCRSLHPERLQRLPVGSLIRADGDRAQRGGVRFETCYACRRPFSPRLRAKPGIGQQHREGRPTPGRTFRNRRARIVSEQPPPGRLLDRARGARAYSVLQNQDFPQNLRPTPDKPCWTSELPGSGSGRGRNPW
jgi:hypothetical protein